MRTPVPARNDREEPADDEEAEQDMETVRPGPKPVPEDVTALRALIDGDLYTPENEGWDEARRAWNLAVDQWPVAVAVPSSAKDVREIVDFARLEGLRVAPQGTGHGASVLGALEDTILVKTHRMRGVTIDAERRVARVEAGAIWMDVVEAAAEHGLAALAGSSPDVGVVGYTLGGGISLLARKHGLGANHVTAAEIVTADAKQRRIDRDNDPDLFWAIRGGGGNLGVVTALEIELFPYAGVYAGILWFPVERAREVLRAWRDWTETVPEEMTSVGRILQLPPIPVFPEEIRGKSFVVVEAIWSGDQAEGETQVAPLRALGPVLDTVKPMTMPELSHLHMDPEGPVPGAGDGGTLIGFDDDAIESLVARTVGAPLLSAEVRHLGGAVARAEPHHGAVATFDAPYIWYAVGMAPTPEAKEAVRDAARSVRAGLEPWAARHTYLNFSETRRDPSTHFTEAAHYRLRRVKSAYDPYGLMTSNHPL
jgi:FAD/FMN-containing dehydrogenase